MRRQSASYGRERGERERGERAKADADVRATAGQEVSARNHSRVNNEAFMSRRA